MAVEIGSLLAKLQLDASDYYRKLDTVERDAGSLGMRLSRGLTSVGTALTAGVTLPLVGIGTAAVKVAADFESQMNVLTVAARSSGTSLEDLRQAAIAVGGDTELIGVSAAEAADAMTSFYKAGLDTTDVFGDLEGYLAGNVSLSGALRAAVDLAAASELDLAQASDAVAIAMATFGLEADDAQRIANSFVGAADASVASVSDLTLAMQNIGPTAAAFGFSLEQTNTALAILSTRGITGAEAGTALKSMLTNMMRDTPDVAQAWEELGTSLYDAEGNMRALPDVMADLETAMADMTQQQRDQYIQTLAGTHGMKAMQTLLEEGSAGWREMEKAINDAATAQEVANARTQGFNSAMETLRGVAETLLIQIGTPLIENFLTPAARKLAEMASALSTSLTPAMADLIVKIGAAVAAGGPIALLLGQLPKLIGFLTGPAGLAIAVGAVAAAWVFDIGGFRQWVADSLAVLEDPKERAELARKAQEAVSKVLKDAADFISTEIAPRAAELWESVKTWVTEAFAFLKENAPTWAAEIGGHIGSALSSAAKWVKDNIGPHVAALWEGIKGWVTDTVARLKDPAYREQIISDIKAGIASLIRGAADAVDLDTQGEKADTLADKIGSWISTTLDDKKDDLVTAVTPGIKAVLDGSAAEAAAQMNTPETNPLVGAFDTIVGNAADEWETNSDKYGANVAQGMIAVVKGAIGTVALAVKGKETFDAFAGATQEGMQASLDARRDKWKSGLIGFFRGFFDEVTKEMTGDEEMGFGPWLDRSAENIGTKLDTMAADIGAWLDRTNVSIGEKTKGWGDTIKEKIGSPEASDSIIGKASKKFNELKDSIVEITAGIGPAMEKLFSDPTDPASAFSLLATAWESLVTAADTAFTSFKDAIIAVVKAIPEKIRAWFDGTPEEGGESVKTQLEGIDLAAVGKGILDSLWTGLKEKWQEVLGWMAGVQQALNSFLNWVTGKRAEADAYVPPGTRSQPRVPGPPGGPAEMGDPNAPGHPWTGQSLIADVTARSKALASDFSATVDQLARVARLMIDVAKELFAEVGDEEQRKILDKQMELFNQLATSTRSLTDAYAALGQELPQIDESRIASIIRVSRELMGALLDAARGMFGDVSADDMDKRLPAIEAFASIGSKLGSFVSSVVDAWGTLAGKLPPVPDDLRDRIGALLGIVAVIADEIQGMTARDWENVAGIADLMQPVMEVVSTAAQALADIAQWKPTPGMGAISTEILKWAVSVVEFIAGHAAARLGEDVPALDRFGDAAGAAMQVLVDTAQALQELAKWTPRAGMGEISTNMALFATSVVELIAGHVAKRMGDDVPNITAFGEAAAAAMQVLTDTAQALIVLKQWTPTAGMGQISTNVALFAAAVVDLIVSLGQRFTQEGLDAARRMAEAQTPIMQAIQATVMMLQALKEWEGAPNLGRISTNVALFAAAVIDLMVSLAARFEQEGLDAAKALADAAGPVMDALNGTLALMAGLKAWEGAEGLGVKSSNVIKFAVAIVDFVIALAEKFDAEGIAAAQRFATAAGPVMSALSSTLDFMNRLKEWEGQAGLGIASTNVIKFAVAVVGLVRALAEQFDEAGLQAAADLGDTIGRVTAGLKTALDLLTGLKDYTAVPETAVLQFEQDLLFIMQRMKVWLSGPLATLADEVVTETAQAIGQVTAGLRGAVDLLTALVDYEAVPDRAMLEFEQDLTFILQRMSFWLKGPLAIYADDIVEKAGRTIGVVLGGLGDALTLLKGLEEYTRPAQDAIENFVADVSKTFKLMADWILLEFADDVPDVIAEFGAAAASLFSGLTNALQLLVGLKDYTTVPQQAITDFMADVQRIVQAFADWLKGRFGDTVDDALLDWGEAMGALFSGLSDALDLLTKLPTYVPPAQSAMDDFVDDVIHMVTYFISIMPPLDEETAKAVTAFGNTIGALFSGLADALDVLQGLVWYVRPSQERMDNFAKDVKALFEKFAEFAKSELVTSSNKAVTEFGAALQTLSGGLGAALGLFEKLMSANFDQWLAKPAGPGQSASPFEKKLQQFNEALYTAIQSWNNWIVNELSPEAIALVGSFSEALGKIASGFGAALQLLIDLNEEGLPSMERLQQYLDLVLMLFRAFIEGEGDTPGMDDIGDLVKGAGQDVIDAMEQARLDLGGEQGKWRLTGIDMMKDGLVVGIEQGLWSAATRLKGAGVGAAQQLLGGFKATLGIASPSKVFMQAASEIPTGIALALDAGRSKVGSALDGLMASAGMDAPSVEIGGRKETHVYYHLDGNGLTGLNPQDRRAILDDLARTMRLQGISVARA